MAIDADDERPLLAPSTSSTPSTSPKPLFQNEEASHGTTDEGIFRSIEDDVLPETSVLGRTISWPSAYILVISSVIGSGIFATPGVIVKSVGSIGLSLTLWVVGAIIAACSLAVSLEYGIFKPEGEGDRRSHFPKGDDLWKDTEWGWGVISTTLFKVFYSYAGLSNINNVMNEVKNPIRTLKSVSVSALVTASVLYLLVNIAYFTVVPLDEIRESKELIAALFFERSFGPNLGKTILPLAVALSSAGNVMVVTFALKSKNILEPSFLWQLQSVYFGYDTSDQI
ncbi:high affinity methionine permease [Pyrenophora tritici-repentis Pt-1C-BFP]|uniref:High affinity methionine permease n=1 Tax=Pyrenophora tritici-repentis (strain Pt-1C-BFP) TaxID=426418 RepID=B2WP96_PYRTR|nr:high affinity methionine permease [Pyrenophora tritici-repentis Pt-1C-BFP]EDU45962.1 high affinity methionine permease [Pyrenophora tritici-repentis Pt-1C-BFP]